MTTEAIKLTPLLSRSDRATSVVLSVCRWAEMISTSGKRLRGLSVDTAVPECDELVGWKVARVSAAGAHLMGRKTYEGMAAHWPSSSAPYAAPMNAIPKVVFSKTLTEAGWPITQIARGDLATEIAAIRDQPGPDVIAYGGASFAAALAGRGLIDEYCLVVQPLALGAGRALFCELTAPLRLELVEARSFDCGVVAKIYRPRRG
jgi:dihydrofolate reductase